MRAKGFLVVSLFLANGCEQREEFIPFEPECMELSALESSERGQKVLEYFLREVDAEVQDVRIATSQRCPKSVIYQIDAYNVEMDRTSRWYVFESEADGQMRLARPE